MARTTKKLSDLITCVYVEFNVCVEPSREEIRQAVEQLELEHRGMGEHQGEIKAWLAAGSNNGQDVGAWIRMMKEYHIKRVAYWVVNEWPKDDKHPIKVNASNQVIEGNHRVRAARYMDKTEIEVEVTE